MDYSQFLFMKQEIALLVVFLLVFFYDTFASKKALNALSGITCVLFGIYTVASFLPCVTGANVTAFSGMYETSPIIAMIKNVLNVGVLIVLIQSVNWANNESTSVRRGEFYELLLVTLFGMYLMISTVISSCLS